jgi:hypothetical protein
MNTIFAFIIGYAVGRFLKSPSSTTLISKCKRYLIINYYFMGNMYKQILPIRKGPIRIIHITNDSSDNLDYILPYLGPFTDIKCIENVYKYFLNNANVDNVNGTTKLLFKNNDGDTHKISTTSREPNN